MEQTSSTMAHVSSVTTIDKHIDTVATMISSVSTDSRTTCSNESSTARTAGKSGGGYPIADNIALGVGIGLGLPILMFTVWPCTRHTRRILVGLS